MKTTSPYEDNLTQKIKDDFTKKIKTTSQNENPPLSLGTISHPNHLAHAFTLNPKNGDDFTQKIKRTSLKK